MQTRVLVRFASSFALLVSALACSSSGDDGPQAPQGGSAGTTSSAAGQGSGVGGISGVTAGSSSGGAASGSTSVGGAAAGTTSGGSPAVGGAGPTGGSSSAGTTTGGGGASAGSATGGAGGGSAGGSTTGMACPSDATFCSGFEDAALPMGAVYKVNAAPGEWTRDFAVDTMVKRGGNSSLRVKSGSDTGTSGSSYQMLAVPAPSGAFWARFYIRQADIDIGGVDHNVFAGASGSDEPNAAGMVEFAEDVGVAFNTSDAVRWPANFGRINGNTMPYTLAKGAWHCIEISFDGTARAQKLYVNGQLQIDATDYPASVAMPFKIFKFGFNKLHGPARSVWYDDVAVGPTRPGCL